MRLSEYPASIQKHHKERGGLIRHLEEVAYIVNQNYDKHIHKIISKERLIFLAHIHDLDRLWLYKEIPENDWRRGRNYRDRYGDFEFTERLAINETAVTQKILNNIDIDLSWSELHILTFHHGGWSVDAQKRSPKITPEACLLHYADMLSCSCDATGVVLPRLSLPSELLERLEHVVHLGSES